MVIFCEHGVEPSGSIKMFGNSSVTEQLAASQGLTCREVVAS
jgi:hypothetical protein